MAAGNKQRIISKTARARGLQADAALAHTLEQNGLCNGQNQELPGRSREGQAARGQNTPKRADRFEAGAFSNSRSSLALLALSGELPAPAASIAANRAECTSARRPAPPLPGRSHPPPRKEEFPETPVSPGPAGNGRPASRPGPPPFWPRWPRMSRRPPPRRGRRENQSVSRTRNLRPGPPDFPRLVRVACGDHQGGHRGDRCQPAPSQGTELISK